MGRPAVKSAKALAKAETEGRIAGEIRATKKIKIFDALKMAATKALDNIDPIEAAAVASMTILIHAKMYDDAQVIERIKSRPWLVPGSLGAMFKQESPEPPQGVSLEDDLKAWVLSYAIAFMVVRHGAEIFAAITDGISGIIKSFILGSTA